MVSSTTEPAPLSVILFHGAAALGALGVGAVLLLRPKGTLDHRLTGRLWVALMVLVALSSFGIQAISPGSFSLIHGLSIYSLAALAWGVVQVRRGNIRAHKRIMQSTYFFGLVLAGALTFLPGRLLNRSLLSWLAG